MAGYTVIQNRIPELIKNDPEFRDYIATRVAAVLIRWREEDGLFTGKNNAGETVEEGSNRDEMQSG